MTKFMKYSRNTPYDSCPNTDYRIACMMPVIVNISFDIKFDFIPSSSWEADILTRKVFI